MRSMKYFAVFVLLLILSSPIAYAPEEHLLPLQGTAKLNDVRMGGGSLIVEIYDAPSGGNLVYNSTNDFTNVITNGAYDILLGNGTQPLSLKYGTKYYMDMYVNSVDVDFNTSERQVFMSTVGNLSVTTPLQTTSNDTDDALNVSSGGAYINGSVVINNFFNITPAASATKTNGTVTILSTDTDDALNVSNGVFIGGNVYIGGNTEFYRFFNVTATASAVRTNGTVTILSLLSPALSINGFNVSGSNAALSTNGTVTMGSTAVIQSTDADDALNVSNGGATFRGQVSIQNYTSAPAFTVNYGFNVSGANNALSTNGTVTIVSLASPALSINGFNVSGSNAALSTNGTVNVNNLFNVTASSGNTEVGGTLDIDGAVTLNSRASPAFSVNSGFNISGADESVRTNGTVTILSFVSPALSINGFNVSGSNAALSTNGTVTLGSTAVIQSTDADDALNVSNGGGNFRGQLGVQNYTAAGPALTVNYGFNVSGANNALSTNGTVTIVSLASPALSINGFNVSGSNAALSTNGTINVNNLFNVTASNGNTEVGGQLSVDGIVFLQNTDGDDALNISGGLAVNSAGGVANFSVGTSGFIVNEQGSIVTQRSIAAGGSTTIRSLDLPAFTINLGFNVSGRDNSLITNGTVSIVSTLAPALSINGFNISGANEELRTNGTVVITSKDADGALNISDVTSGIFIAGNTVFNNRFNITGSNGNTRITGTVTIDSPDQDDAVNVTSGNVNIGNDASTSQHRLTIYDGGANKCAALILFDESGADWFLFANTTGQLRMATDLPTTCDTEGQSVGGQPT